MKRGFYIAAAGVVFLLSGCSSFDAEWRAARGERTAFAGAYEGRWQSGQAGAGGALRCVLTRRDAGHTEARFHATWHGIFQSTHRVLLATQAAGEGLAFEGTATLQTIIGAGSYRCWGSIAPGALNAHYDAAYDVGTFTLVRVKSQ